MLAASGRHVLLRVGPRGAGDPADDHPGAGAGQQYAGRVAVLDGPAGSRHHRGLPDPDRSGGRDPPRRHRGGDRGEQRDPEADGEHQDGGDRALAQGQREGPPGQPRPAAVSRAALRGLRARGHANPPVRPGHDHEGPAAPCSAEGRGVVGHVAEQLARRPLGSPRRAGAAAVASSAARHVARRAPIESRWAIMLSRARRLSSASTTHHGASGMSVCTNISSLARENSTHGRGDARSFVGELPRASSGRPGATEAPLLLLVADREPVLAQQDRRPRRAAARRSGTGAGTAGTPAGVQ